MTETSPKKTIGIERIKQLLPHRYPFLLVDKIIEMEGEQSCIGIKNVTINEPFFPGHFPQRAVMPGVLIIEALAQAAGAMTMEANVEYAGKIVFLTSIDGARFRKPVSPGDTLHLHIQLTARRGALYKWRCEAKVDGKLMVEADIGAILADGK